VPLKEAELSALLHGNVDPGGTTSRRLDFFRSSLAAMASHPLTGVGLAGWSNYYYGAYSGPDRAAYPHNFVLEVAAEQGIPGLTALLVLLGAMIVALRRVRSAHSEFSFVLPVVLFSILLNAITGNIEDRVFFFWLSAGFVAARFTLREHTPAELIERPEYEYSARRLA
jgi:O-antigen ligase